MIARVLVVAGSDSGAGAGIQADIKTVMALGGYATTALTAVTAQNTLGVQCVAGIDPAMVRAQMLAVLDDIGADAIKTGMLFDAAVVEVVAETLAGHARSIPLVLDPVMVAKGGTALLSSAAVAAMCTRLFPLAAILTPNVPEAEHLLGRKIRDLAEMKLAASTLLLQGPRAVLLKGGHLPSPQVHDVLAIAGKVTVHTDDRFESAHTHGTGCTLASAIATGLAQGMTTDDAVVRARAYVRAAILAAPGLGQGHGPLGHAVG